MKVLKEKIKSFGETTFLRRFRKFTLKYICDEYLIFYIYETTPAMPGSEGIIPGGLEFKWIDTLEALKSIKSADLPDFKEEFCGKTHFFAAMVGNSLSSVCWVLGDSAYHKKRKFWPLKSDEAKLINLSTVTAFRGQGIAPVLISFAKKQMHSLGYTNIYARIWHSNKASKIAFEKAGWRKKALVITAALLGNRIPIRFTWFFPERDFNFQLFCGHESRA